MEMLVPIVRPLLRVGDFIYPNFGTRHKLTWAVPVPHFYVDNSRAKYELHLVIGFVEGEILALSPNGEIGLFFAEASLFYKR